MTEEPGNARGPHVPPDVLADLQAGLLHDRAERAAREHLVACPACQADLEVLAAIPGRLAAAGSVEPIPADVASRLDAALAAAASAPPDMAATPTIVPGLATTATHRRDRSSPRGLRLLQAAAVLVVVLGLGALAVSAIHAGRDGSGGASTAGAADSAGGAKSAPQAAFPVTASGRDWTAGSLTAAVPRLVAGSLSPVITRGPLDDSTLKSAAGSGSSTPAPSGSVSAAAVPEYAVSGNAAGRLAGGTALAACVAGLVGGPATPLAVDLATYQGKPAAVILLPGLAGPDRIDVWVVPADCSSTTATFLYYGSVPRP